MPFDFERQNKVEMALVKLRGLPGRSDFTKRKSLEFLAMLDAVVEHQRSIRSKKRDARDDETTLTTSIPPAASSTE